MDNCDSLVFLFIIEILISICLLCFKRTNACFSCGIAFAEWHCPKCNLWMDLSKRPFHCDKCGICRVGGQDNFRHCEQCCMCISVAVYETHNCIKDKYKSEALPTFIRLFVVAALTLLSVCFSPFRARQLSSVPRGHVFVSTKPARFAMWACYSCEFHFYIRFIAGAGIHILIVNVGALFQKLSGI